MEKIDKVNSSEIAKMSWDGSVLSIKFHTDCIYSYQDVPKAIWKALKTRNSKRKLGDPSTDKYSVGKYFNKEVKGSYKFTTSGKGCPKGT